MFRKPKFKPVVTRVKLNPEQAVLTCTCSSNGYVKVSGSGSVSACTSSTVRTLIVCRSARTVASSS